MIVDLVDQVCGDLDGKVVGFICAVGTGGTLAGVSAGLKEHNPGVVIGIADPMGAARTAEMKSRSLIGRRWPTSRKTRRNI